MTRGLEIVSRAEVVVVGGGVAGLTAALGAAPRPVTLLTKTRFARGGNSVHAQGGVAVAWGRDDSPQLHARDTVEAGAGLTDPRLAEILAVGGPRAIGRLLELGARFDRAPDGTLALGREAAHRRRRVLHADGDATGAEIVRALADAVSRAEHVRIEEESFAVDLVALGGRVVGVLARTVAGRPILHLAPSVVLATGGSGRLYRFTTNPPEATADGLAMAARAGAVLSDLEFVQFHPTALAAGRDPLPLLTEALRGEGSTIVDERGVRFLCTLHEAAELAPRDVVARGIWSHLAAGHRVYLDAREAVGERFPERFPTVFSLCREQGLDPRTDLLPVSPAAHYHMGGVRVDACGRSSLRGLWACGEVASSGLHGANRLASNSLLEALVFGARVAEGVREAIAAMPGREAAIEAIDPLSLEAAKAPGRRDPELADSVRDRMWQDVGLLRDAAGLARARESFRALAEEHRGGRGEARNLLTTARLVAEAAWYRKESRGGHRREDYPRADEHWRHRLELRAPGHEPAPRIEVSRAALAEESVA